MMPYHWIDYANEVRKDSSVGVTNRTETGKQNSENHDFIADIRISFLLFFLTFSRDFMETLFCLFVISILPFHSAKNLPIIANNITFIKR